MNKSILSAAILAALITGCSSTKPESVGYNPGAGATTAISEQRLATSEFKRQGIKISYTFSGDIESIEATGYAPVWGNSQNAAREAFRVAELEAKKSLNDFINKESIVTTTSVRMVSANLEHAKDQKSNKFSSNKPGATDELVAIDEEITGKSNSKNEQTQENTATRNDALAIATRLNNNITVNNRGILGGLYLVEGQVINDGKTVKAIYRWDKKSNATRVTLRNLMSQ